MENIQKEEHPTRAEGAASNGEIGDRNRITVPENYRAPDVKIVPFWSKANEQEGGRLAALRPGRGPSLGWYC